MDNEKQLRRSMIEELLEQATEQLKELQREYNEEPSSFLRNDIARVKSEIQKLKGSLSNLPK